MAGGRDPADSQVTSYRRSATNGLTVFIISAVSGFTANTKLFIDFYNVMASRWFINNKKHYLHRRSKSTEASLGSVMTVLIA